ncbi:hypothetical protein BGW80DRAFT_1320386 [Lactifluus volemus]|nr:hypothetical protein BGW80DRAFT_1320386 [Lactifluus volemus]
MPDEAAVHEESLVDALGEPIDPAWFDNGIVIWSSEEVSGVEAARVAQALTNTLQFLDTYFSTH